MLKYALGMDASKKDIHVCLSVIDSRQQVKVKASSKFGNSIQGFKDLLVWLNRHKKESDIPLVNVIEATGYIMKLVPCFCLKPDWMLLLCCLIKPKSICRRWASDQRMTR